MKIKLTQLFCILVLSLMTEYGYSQITSAKSGNWNTPDTWVGDVVPTSTTDVVIAAGHIVTVNDATATSKNISFGATTSQLNMSTVTSVLTVTGNFTILASHTAFIFWEPGAKLKFSGGANQLLNGWSTSTTVTTSLMEVIVDKSAGKLSTPGSGANVKFGIGTSLEIINGTFELGLDDDIQGASRAGGTSTQPSITIQQGGIFNMVGGSSYIRSRTNIADDASKIGKLTVYGTANLVAGNDNDRRINFNGIDIENNGVVEFPTGRSTATGMFNPGTVTIKTGGIFKNNLTTAYWFVNATTQTKVIIEGGEFNFAATQTLPQVFTITPGAGGFVRYSNTGTQTLPSSITTYENLILSTSNVKTLGGNVTVNGILSLRGSATLNTGGFILTYGSAATLQYGASGQTSAQTTTDNEWPVTGSVPANITIYNGGGVTLHAPRSISGTLTLTLGNFNLGANVLTLKSDPNGTARVAPVTSGTITGNVSVERYFGARKAWRLITSPLANSTGDVSVFSTWQLNGAIATGQGTHVTGTVAPTVDNGLDAQTPGASMKLFPNTIGGQILVNVENTKTTALFGTPSGVFAANKSYFTFVYGDRTGTAPNQTPSVTTLTATGQLQIGAKRFATVNAPDAYTLVGNPYASPVDLQKFCVANLSSNTKNSYYYWDPYLGSNGGYVTVSYDAAGSIGSQTIAPVTAGQSATANQTQYLQSGQAMFLQTKSTLVAGNNEYVDFQEDQKAAVNVTGIFRTSAGSEKLSINLNTIVNSNSILTDGVVTSFNDGYSTQVDDNDAVKLYNITEGISLSRNNKALSIERRAPVVSADTVFILINNMSAGKNYSFDIVSDFSTPGMMAFLQDKTKPAVNTPLNMNGTTTFNFNVTSDAVTSAEDRFRIVFTPAGPLPVTLTSIKAYQQSNSVIVDWKTENEVRIKSYQVEKSNDGASYNKIGDIAAQNTVSASYTFTDVTPSNGFNFYRIRSVGIDGDVKYSKVVRVNIGSNKNPVSIYPNPLEGNILALTLNDLPAGLYSFSISNNLGQQVLIKTIKHIGGSATQTIELNNSITSGTYQLEVKAKGFAITQQIIKK